MISCETYINYYLNHFSEKERGVYVNYSMTKNKVETYIDIIAGLNPDQLKQHSDYPSWADDNTNHL
jgi:hypothetical protein